MRIYVTRKDIEAAREHRLDTARDYRSYSHCPIARAISRRFPGSPVAVGIENVQAGNHRTLLSDEAKDFIALFDSERDVEPVVLELDL